MGKANCTYPFCEEPKDKERDTGMCEEHSSRWLRSQAFLDAAKDKNVRACASLGLKAQMKRELTKLRRKWAKAEAAREGGE